MASINTAKIFRLLRKTLDKVITDDTDGIQADAVFPKFCDVQEMDHAYSDETELAGPGLVSEKPEGTEIALGSINMGFQKRYIAGTWALKLHITQEAIEDNKYPEAVPLARMLKRSIWDTADVCAALMLARASNTNYVGGDGVPLASASHTLPGGGTFSNTMAVPMSPSNMALSLARAAIATMPALNGIRRPLKAEKVVFPIEQQSIWDVLLGSDKSPEPGQFNAMNIAKKMNLTPVAVHHWTNTQTNWGLITNVEDGLKFKWRIRPESRSWMDNDNTTMKYATRGRWTTGWTNARGFYFVEV